METMDCVVIGAGVVGIAVARALSLAGREVLVLEAAEGIGTETSSRNSEVIHAGIYYPANSLMARLCVRGKWQLYDFCREHGVAHRACGKLIVATDEAEAEQLDTIRARAAANGVDDLRRLTQAEARSLEPNLSCTAALLSPSTGIVDSHAYMLALQGEAEAAGALFVFRSPVLDGRADEDGVELRVGGAEPMVLRASLVVNAAGLHAPALARCHRGHAARSGAHGVLRQRQLFYPRRPLAIRAADLSGAGGRRAWRASDHRPGWSGPLRPDVEWVAAPEYGVDPARAEVFYAAVRRYWPDLPDGALQAGYAGIRPKIVPPSVARQDFLVQGRATHGIAGLVNLFGIESPGLTAAIALADYVREIAA